VTFILSERQKLFKRKVLLQKLQRKDETREQGDVIFSDGLSTVLK